MKIKIIYLLFLVSGCVLFTTPNSANCKTDAKCQHPATGATVKATAVETVPSTEEKDIDFTPITTILAGYNILFN